MSFVEINTLIGYKYFVFSPFCLIWNVPTFEKINLEKKTWIDNTLLMEGEDIF